MHKKKNYNIIAFYFCIIVDLQHNVKVFVANSSLSPIIFNLKGPNGTESHTFTL